MDNQLEWLIYTYGEKLLRLYVNDIEEEIIDGVSVPLP